MREESFTILGTKVQVEEVATDLGWTTIAHLDGQKLDVGDEPIDILTAVCAYQRVRDRELNPSELKHVLSEHGWNRRDLAALFARPGESSFRP